MNRYFKSFLLFTVGVVALTGCATTRARRPDPKVEQANQIAQMQADLQAKDAKIQELQGKVESYQAALDSVPSSRANHDAYGQSGKHAGFIHVSGVTVEDVQKALVRAGLDPGPVDGNAGRKTKSAIKAFQRRHNLKADGIVGEKTWEHLK